jgi:transposase
VSVASSRRYPSDLRERAVRMVAESRSEHRSDWATIESVASKLGIGTAQTFLSWVRRAQVDSRPRGGATTVHQPHTGKAQNSSSTVPPRGE